jgi:hypothetical protein
MCVAARHEAEKLMGKTKQKILFAISDLCLIALGFLLSALVLANLDKILSLLLQLIAAYSQH